MSTNDIDPHANQDTGFETAKFYKTLADLGENVATPESTERRPIETGLSEFFTSPEFTQTIAGFPDAMRDSAIGWSVEYSIVMNEAHPEAINEYLSEIQATQDLDAMTHHDIEKLKAQIFVDQAASKLGFDDTDSLEAQEAIYSFISDNYHQNGYYFHSFNGAFEDSIRKHGIDPNTRPWDQEDVRKECSWAGPA